jgi:xanthine dehydrogenase accessory factor
MKAFYEAVSSLSPYEEALAATVVAGKNCGEKILAGSEGLRYSSDPQGFLAGHLSLLRTLPLNAVSEVEGRRVFVEHLGSRPQMVICGAGHVSIPIIRIAKMVGMHVTVLDDREEFADKAEKAGADKVFCGDFSSILSGIPGGRDVYFVDVTRGHRFDEACLRVMLKKPHAYIGMMGSRRRVAMVKEKMIEEGYDADTVNAVYTPIGLDIGSETPEEIAVAVMAEIIQVKNKRSQSLYPEDILKAILGSEHEPAYPGRMILAEIIDRTGSAARSVGTKMLVKEDGSIVNTIGGGLMEALVIRRGLEMLKQEKPEPCLFKDELTADKAAEEGEVCGGTVEIFLEEVGQ